MLLGLRKLGVIHGGGCGGRGGGCCNLGGFGSNLGGFGSSGGGSNVGFGAVQLELEVGDLATQAVAFFAGGA